MKLEKNCKELLRKDLLNVLINSFELCLLRNQSICLSDFKSTQHLEKMCKIEEMTSRVGYYMISFWLLLHACHL